MKGIVLAGGSGSRLYPITKSVSKQLLPVYDKPMIYYSLSVLLLAGIKEILIISTPEDIENYRKLFKTGYHIGVKIKYEVQEKPEGLAQAFIIGEKFIGNDSVTLILGDNIFYGDGFQNLLRKKVYNSQSSNKANIFGCYVNDPQRFGVVELDNNNNPISIEEKPLIPKSNFAVVGLYIYPNDVVNISKNIKPSDRGELEITSINEYYLKENKLDVEIFGRGYTWLDTGTKDSLLEASNFIHIAEKKQGLKIGCIEEIAFRSGFISKNQLMKISKSIYNTNYGKYLYDLAKNL